ncbi:MAG: dual specificity protein phosphatase family protein [Sphingomonadaceae bacterium]|nr:dual specificity protein phosphatase family protein [Sphingomonadaceae bacterium]
MLSWLTETLAVGGRFPVEQVAELAGPLGMRAIVDLRAECCDDVALLSSHGLAFLHLPTPDLEPVSPAMLLEGVAFATGHLARGERVLIHCEYGIGRSALLALCILVDRGLPPFDALRLAKRRRSIISPNAVQYRAWAQWLDRRGERAPDFDTFAAIAYARAV